MLGERVEVLLVLAEGYWWSQGLGTAGVEKPLAHCFEEEHFAVTRSFEHSVVAASPAHFRPR